VPTANGLEIHPTGGTSSVQPGAASAVAAHGGSGDDIVAYGSGAKVTIATASGTSLKVLSEISDNRGDILVLAFSKDGSLLASGDVSTRRILELTVVDRQDRLDRCCEEGNASIVQVDESYGSNNFIGFL
jgi:hypothetical protein